MSYEDYDQREIDGIIEVLLEEHSDKLKQEEITFLYQLYKKKVTQQQRDLLLQMHDRMAEANY